MVGRTRIGRARIRIGEFCLRLRETEGSQIVELAIVLPILMVLVVGIFDFGNAFNLKQKLTNAARAGARFGSYSPTSDLASAGTPNSVIAIRNLVDNYLVSQGINDCGLTRTFGTPGGAPLLSWSFTATGNGCPTPGLTLTVDRSCCAGAGVPASAGTATIQVVSTHIQISYPYKWTFDNVIGLLSPGTTYPGITQISTDALVGNLD